MNFLNKLYAKENSALHHAIQTNAIFSDLSGIVLIFWSKPIAEMFAVENNIVFVVFGIGLLGWALMLFKESLKPIISNTFAKYVITGDVMWVVGSIVIISANLFSLSLTGKWAIVIIGDFVLGLAIWEYFALRKQS